MSFYGIGKMTEAEKDKVAAMVLALVQEIARGVEPKFGPRLLPQGPEATGTGYLPPSVREIVMKRSA